MTGSTNFLLFTMATSLLFGTFVSVQLLEKTGFQSRILEKQETRK